MRQIRAVHRARGDVDSYRGGVQTTLADHVWSYLDDDEVELRPHDPDREARTNTWAYSVDGSDPDQTPAVVAALRDVADGLRLRLRDSTVRGKFYAWYDEQAGQLRCSLTSLESLPFDATLRPRSDPGPIVQAALSDPSPEFIDLDGAVDAPADFLEESGTTLEVWVAQV